MKRPKWIPRWLNAPLIIFVAFIVLLMCFGENNYMKINDYRQKANEYKAEIKANEDSAAAYEKRIDELHTDRESLEKIAREKYGMKRKNEDVYITNVP